jgi:S-adenosylmethionine synthetase
MAEPALVVLGPPASTHPDALETEIVERKGRGHPDTICDALAEAFSIGLSRAYAQAAGAILHHNVDKVLLAAGSSAPRFGGGDLLAPIDLYLAGRATSSFDGIPIPVAEIAHETTRAWMQANLHALEMSRHVRLHTLVRPGSAALSGLLARGQAPVANDTSFGVGYAPSSRLERVVLAVEQALTAPATIASHPVIGEDVKVMGFRRGQHIDLTVACAMVDRHVRSASAYADAKTLVSRLAAEASREAGAAHLRVQVNTGDDEASGRLYLTVTGTSAEAGDDGEAGRGNRVGGLITPARPMTLEAAAGKNAVSHVGKLYGIVAHRMANDLVEMPEIAEATCAVVSRIGWPVDAPLVVEVRLRTRDDLPVGTLQAPVEALVHRCLGGLRDLPQKLLDHASIESPAGWPGMLLF